MNKIYAPYLIYKDQNGFYNETKYHSDIDFDVLEKNSGIIDSFYGEKILVKAINGNLINDKFIFIENSKPLEISKEFVLQKSKEIFIEILKEFSNYKYIDYKKNKDDISFKEKILKIFNAFNLDIKFDHKNKFDKKKYLDNVKEISLYTSLSFPLENKQEILYLKKIKNIVKSLNTILAIEEIKIDPEKVSEKYFNLTISTNENGELKKIFKYSSEIDEIEYNLLNSLKLNEKNNKNYLKLK